MVLDKETIAADFVRDYCRTYYHVKLHPTDIHILDTIVDPHDSRQNDSNADWKVIIEIYREKDKPMGRNHIFIEVIKIGNKFYADIYQRNEQRFEANA